MALSLVCKDCNALLRNVAEAQAHNDATGHANFEESTAAVKRMVCTECGKPCKSEEEQTLHTRFTGHASFVDKTNEAAVLDTENEMKAAQAALKEELAPSRATHMSEAGVSGVPAEGENMVPPVVNEELHKELQDMGFTANKALRALHFSGADNLEAAVNWLVEHEADEDLDTPLLVPESQAKPKEKLNPEEARRKAEELVRRAKERREREEAEAERERERERIRAGKELLIAKEKEREAAMKRNIEARKREKEEEARARDAIRARLEEDRRERRKKLGLPEELTEEEKARDAERAAQAKKEAESKRHVYIKPVSVIDKVRSLLVAGKKAHAHEVDKFNTACTIMLKYVGNIATNPDEDKFRTLKLGNAAFQAKVAPVSGALDVLQAIGFQKGEETLTMPRESVNMELLQLAGSELNNALTNPFFGAL